MSNTTKILIGLVVGSIFLCCICFGTLAILVDTDESEDDEITDKIESEDSDSDSSNGVNEQFEEEKSTTTEVKEEQEKVEVPEETVSQKNAVKSAKSYLDFAAFSYTGLIKQLEYEGYSNEDATYGVNNVEVDWFQQAAKSAKSYLDFTAFSRSGLIDQLIYEGFTQEQAEFGANSVGL